MRSSMATSAIVLVLGALFVASCQAVDYTGAWGNSTAEDDFVPSLPEVGTLPFPLYAGYVVVNESAGRALYYLFTPCVAAPETAPLILWLNGGPGCSSLASGFAEELGPLYMNGSGGLKPNPYTWSNFASVIYLDSPAGTGFSYSLTDSDKIVGDERTLADVYLFLLGWFKRFPGYTTQKFYVMGESYAGRYVPQAALNVFEGNKLVAAADRINLVGVAIGNGVTDPYYDQLGQIDYLHSHAIISDEVYKGLMHDCDLHTTQLTSIGKSCPSPSKGDCCTYWIYKSGLYGALPNVLDEMGDISEYSVNGEWPCPATVNQAYSGTNATAAPRRLQARRQAHVLAEHRPMAKLALGLAKQQHGRALKMQGSEPYTFNSKFPVECIDPDMMAYYQRADVQLAIHANQTVKIPYKFVPCAHSNELTYTSGNNSMLPIYKIFIENDIQMLVFNGDADAVVPITGTRYGINSLGLDILLPWAPWYSCTGNVGGRRVRYKGLDLFTVRASGHEVPWYESERASFMMKMYLGIPITCATRCATCSEPE